MIEKIFLKNFLKYKNQIYRRNSVDGSCPSAMQADAALSVSACMWGEGKISVIIVIITVVIVIIITVVIVIIIRVPVI